MSRKMTPFLPAVERLSNRKKMRKNSIFQIVEERKLEDSIFSQSLKTEKNQNQRKKEPKIVKEFKLFKECFEEFKPKNTFLRRRLGGIYSRAGKKKKLSRIEYNLKTEKYSPKKEKPTRDEETDRIMRVQSSINFFKNSAKKGDNFKEYHEEMRSIKNLKKLTFDHVKNEKKHDITIKRIRDSIRHLSALKSPKPYHLKNIQKEVNKVEKEYNNTMNSIANIQKIFSKQNGTKYRKNNRRCSRSIGHLKLSSIQKKKKSKKFKLPRCFRVKENKSTKQQFNFDNNK